MIIQIIDYVEYGLSYTKATCYVMGYKVFYTIHNEFAKIVDL